MSSPLSHDLTHIHTMIMTSSCIDPLRDVHFTDRTCHLTHVCCPKNKTSASDITQQGYPREINCQINFDLKFKAIFLSSTSNHTPICEPLLQSCTNPVYFSCVSNDKTPQADSEKVYNWMIIHRNILFFLQMKTYEPKQEVIVVVNSIPQGHALTYEHEGLTAVGLLSCKVNKCIY